MNCSFCGNPVPEGLTACPSCRAGLAGFSQGATVQASPVAGQPAYAAQPQSQFQSQPQYQAAYGQPAQAAYGAPQGGAPVPPNGGRSVGGPDLAAPSRKGRTVAIVAAVVAVVLAVAAVVGLAYACVIDVPFLPKNPGLALAKGVDNAVGSGDFDFEMSADVGMKYAADDQQAGIDLDVDATGKVRGYEADDPSTLKVEDGTFGLVASVPELESLGSYTVSGEYDLDFAEGVINYVLKEPYSYSGSEEIDTDSLLDGADDDASLNLDYVRDLKMEGDTVTFTVDSEALMDDEDMRNVIEKLENLGISFDVDLDDIYVTAVIDSAYGRVDMNMKTSVSVKAEGAGLLEMAAGASSLSYYMDMDVDLSLQRA